LRNTTGEATHDKALLFQRTPDTTGVLTQLVGNDDDLAFVAFQFIQLSGNLAEWNIDGTDNVARFEFCIVANIEQNSRILVEHLGDFMHGDGTTTLDALTPGVDINQNHQRTNQQPFLTDKYTEIHRLQIPLAMSRNRSHHLVIIADSDKPAL